MQRILILFLIACGMLLAGGAHADARHGPHAQVQAVCVDHDGHGAAPHGSSAAGHCCATSAAALPPSAPRWSPPRLSPTYQTRIPALPLTRDPDRIFRPPKSLS